MVILVEEDADDRTTMTTDVCEGLN